MVKWVSKGRDIVEAMLEKLTPGTKEHNSVSMRRDSRKFLLNAVYGTLGDQKFRLFNLEMAEKITALCRAGIKAVAKFCESMGFSVIYGDTDSVMVSLEHGKKNDNIQELVDKGLKFISKINRFLGTYFKTDKSDLIRFKMEKIWQPIVMTGKKKQYFGRVVWQDGKLVDRIVVRGLRNRRRDSSSLTKRVMIEVYNFILYKTVDMVLPYVRSEIQKFRTNPIEDIMVNMGVQQDLHRYKVNSWHKRASEYANTYIYKTDQIKEGSRIYIMYCHVKNPTEEYPNTDVIAVEDPDDLPEGIFEPNWQEMLDKCIKKPLEGIFNAVGLKWEDLTPRKNVKKLFKKKRCRK